MPQEIQRFVELLGKSKLMESLNITAADFAEMLIDREVVTRWQAEKLLDGKFKGFYLDEFLLLYRHHTDEDRSYFAAKKVDSGELVILAVHPYSRSKPGDQQIHYDVLPFEDD